MPSTLVHLGVAALIGTVLLGRHFDGRALFVVLAAATVPDLDTFIGLWLIDGGHRTVLHNLVLPTFVLGVIWWDTRWRSRSALHDRYGDAGVRVAWVMILGGWVISQVLLDAFYNGANLFWPLYDQFIDLSGRMYISDQEGFVQTFFAIDIGPEGITIGEEHARGGTGDQHYYTGIDLGPGAEPDQERIFPIAYSGELFLITIVGYTAAAFRLWDRRGEANE